MGPFDIRHCFLNPVYIQWVLIMTSVEAFKGVRIPAPTHPVHIALAVGGKAGVETVRDNLTGRNLAI